MDRDRIGYLVDLIRVLVAKELQIRYRGTALGVMWSLANPLAFAAVLHVAFKHAFRVAIDDYPLFILAVLFPWQWISNSLGAAPMVFISNGSLIKKLPFPRSALCVAVVSTDLIHFLVTLPVYAVLLVLFSDRTWPFASWVLGVPLLVVAQFGIVLGAVLVLSTLNTFFRDLDQMVRVGLLLLFYITPILYPVSFLPPNFQWLIFLNPLAPLMVSWRQLLFEGTLGPYAALALLEAAATLGLAAALYRRTGWRVAEVV